MGAFIGLPPSLIETYSGDIKKMYQANGVPLYLGLVTMFISSLVHLTIMSSIIVILSPVLFDAELPKNLPLFYGALIIFIAVSLSLGSILGLLVKTLGIDLVIWIIKKMQSDKSDNKEEKKNAC